MKETTLGPTVLLMSGRTLALLGAFALPLLLVRIFDPAAFGTYKQLVLVYTTLYLVGQFGMAESLFYFIPMHPRDAGRHTANASLALGAAGALAGGAVLLGGPLLVDAFDNPALAAGTGALAAFTALTLASTQLETVMVARKRYRLAAAAYGLTDLVRALAFVAGALAFRSVEGIFLAGALFAALRLALTLAYLAREFPGTLRPALVPFLAQAAYALPFAAAIVLEIAQTTYHQYAVSFAFDAAAFAVYSVGCLQLPFVDLVYGSAGNVMMVRMGEERREGNTSAVVELWHETTRRLALVFFPVTVLLAIVAADLIPLLFTESYRASVPILYVWSVTIALSAFMTDAVLRVYADTRSILWLNLLRLGLNVALIALLVGRLGLPGAALATVVAVAAVKLVGLLRIGQRMGVGLSALLPWRDLGLALGASAAAAAAALLVRASLQAPRVAMLAVVAAVFTVVYGLLAAGLDLVRRDERSAVAGWLRRLGGARLLGSAEAA